MNYVIVIWAVWGVLGVVLLGLILYRSNITRYEDDQLFLDDAAAMQHHEQEEILRRVKPIERMIRICGGAEGLATLAIVAFYLMDALHQF